MNKQDIAIVAAGLGKKYRLGLLKSGAAMHYQLEQVCCRPVRSLSRMLSRGREGTSLEKKSFRALRDVSFEINHGEVVGIVGHNGAGKSVLLKILSRITQPSEGEVLND